MKLDSALESVTHLFLDFPRSQAEHGNVALETIASCASLHLAKLVRLEPLSGRDQAQPGHEEINCKQCSRRL